MEEELNLDGSLGLLNVLSLLKYGLHNSDDGKAGFEILTEEQINLLFQSNRLVQKIICRYPNEAKAVGYKILDAKGNLISENDPVVLEGFEEAAIFARLHGKAYLIFSNGDLDGRPLELSDELIGYRLLFDLKRQGDFYLNNKARIHNSRVLLFLGARTYKKSVGENDPNYAQSILQGLCKSFSRYTNGADCISHIIENLSYLKIGLKGLASSTRTKEGQARVFSRLQAVNANRQIDRLIAHDKDTEEIGFIQQTLAGLSEALEPLKELAVAECEYPYSILFEETPKNGLGTGTQNQLVARWLWASRTLDWARNNWLSNYKKLFKNLIAEPHKIELPLNFQLTEMEQAELEAKAAERTAKLISAGVLKPAEGATGYRGSEFTLNIELQNEER